MNKQTIITILLALAAMAGQGQVRCHVIGTVAEGTTSVELRIYRDGEDPKDSTLRPVLKNGRFECDVEDAQIERWHIVDFGEVMEKGMTLRTGEFFVEDNATVTIRLDGDKFDIQSTGKEYQAWHAMEQAAEEKFMYAYECHDGVRTICDSHRFLTRDIFLRKNSQKVCLLRKYSYLCGVVRHYVKLKNFRLWETQNSKKLKIVLNFQDCLVVSNFLSTFANEYET